MKVLKVISISVLITAAALPYVSPTAYADVTPTTVSSVNVVEGYLGYLAVKYLN